MNTCYYLVGLPGSGKSTYAKELSKETGALIFSSDVIREEIGADGGDTSKHSEVFQILHRRLKGGLLRGNDVIYDATNISYKNRVSFLNELGKLNIEINKICIITATPYEVCKMFNRMRTEAVPDEVIDRMYKSWTTPYYSEGWDQIYVHYHHKSFKGFYGTPRSFCKSYYYWSQNNPHHKYGLGQHMWNVADNIIIDTLTNVNGNELFYAAMIHDCGKPFTEKQDPNGISHYFNHDSVGAYDSLFFDYSDDVDIVYISFLVNHHMKPFGWKDNLEQAKEKFIDRYGEKELHDVLILHNADVSEKD